MMIAIWSRSRWVVQLNKLSLPFCLTWLQCTPIKTKMYSEKIHDTHSNTTYFWLYSIEMRNNKNTFHENTNIIFEILSDFIITI